MTTNLCGFYFFVIYLNNPSVANRDCYDNSACSVDNFPSVSDSNILVSERSKIHIIFLHKVFFTVYILIFLITNNNLASQYIVVLNL